MLDTLIKALMLIAFISLGYFLKRLGVFDRSSFNTISAIVMTITLPCVIIVKLNGVHFETSLFIITFIAILLNLLFIAIGYFIGKSKKEKSFSMLNLSGYNIGNFALPFVSYFFDSTAVLIVCLFDAGNSLMCLGATYGLACCVDKQKDENILLLLAKKIFSSIPILTYVVVVIMLLTSIQFPAVLIEWASIASSANTFLCMLMVGIALELVLKKDFIILIVKHIAIRFIVSALLAMSFYFFLPFEAVITKTLIILTFAPIAGMACFFTAKMNGNLEASACINSLYIFISIIMMSALIILLN